MHFGDVLVQFKIFTATKELHKTQCCDFKIVSISEIYTLGGVDRKSMPLIIRFYSLFYFFRKSLEEERSIYRFCKMMCIFTHSFTHVSVWWWILKCPAQQISRTDESTGL